MTFGQYFRIWILSLLIISIVYAALNIGDWVTDATGSKIAGKGATLIFLSLLVSAAISSFSEYSEKKAKRRLRELEEAERKPKR